MPHSPHSPASTTSKAGSDDNTTPQDRMSEAALRKKKNADAQAAFRARRANYIATLEETVTNLEAVVLQLQDSCREAKSEVNELRAENARLRLQRSESEKNANARFQWQHAKKNNGPPESPGDDFPLPTYGPVHNPGGVVPALNGSHVNHYNNTFSTAGDPSASLSNASYHSNNNQDYPQRSPAMGFAGMDNNDGETRSQHADSHRNPRYGPYPAYPMDGNSREPWQSGEPPSLEGSASGHSPSFVESPSLTASDLNYPSRFPVSEDQKLPIGPINTPSYMFPSSRSMSPAASTPTSTSSTSLAPAPFQFTFPDANMGQDRPDFGYHRQPPPSHPELTLRGGTADIPMAGTGGEVLRYRMTRGGPPVGSGGGGGSSGNGAITPYSRTENSSHDRESDDGGEAAPYHYATRARQRRSTTTSRTSRSPSPGPAPICGTLAVIKAQAFGALRRTRTRSKKSSEGAAKAAVEALEARGIGMGIGGGGATKRPRLHHDDGEGA
ncbi:hypothetical protein EUX98_g79 [Antrodiella citrinella]|uniref:BZIP domain-containing protein n=1 Tax=Antrodiella citrinella TaxID=2447956 RepID=A0A4S4NDL1_9APHY|nr:hypothetical protein EUX98_g79 [Antrodiella citrinella]